MLKYSILGGVFDPIHQGHLAIAREMMRRFPTLQNIFFVPAGMPPHKKPPVAPPWVRFGLVLTAIANEPQWLAWDHEIRYYPEPCYTYETLRAFHRLYKTEPYEVAFVVGGDAFIHIHQWYRADLLKDMATWVVFSRPPVDVITLRQYLKSRFPDWKSVPPTDLSGQQEAVVTFIEDFSYPVSSTEIRQRILHNQPFEHLLHPNVAELIRRHGWYRPSEGGPSE